MATFNVAAIFVFFAAIIVASKATMNVKGRVYCDPCQVEFQTKISTPISGVKVKLTCRGIGNDSTTLETEGVTDNNGVYSLEVTGDHEVDICEVTPVAAASGTECNVPFKTVNSARVLLTKNVGVVSPARSASALGYMTKTVDPRCKAVLLDMGFLPGTSDQSV